MIAKPIDPLTVGAQVPDFELETYSPANCAFGKLSLKDIKARKKWLVLVFYPADFTFVCPTELADLASHYPALQQLGAEVVSVSPDSKFVHLAWHRAEKRLAEISFPMAADPTRSVSRLFGVCDTASRMSLWGTFIINPSGVLVSTQVNHFRIGGIGEELRRKLEMFIYVRNLPAPACSAIWKAGRTILTPSVQSSSCRSA